MKKKKVVAKNIWIPFLIIFIFIGGGCVFWYQSQHQEKEKKPNTEEKPNITTDPVDRKQEEKLKQLDHIEKKIDYFKMDYLDRYLDYLEKNPKLSKEDVVTRVNIGLDQDYYTNTKETPYLNTTYLLSNKYLSMPQDYVPEGLEDISSDCALSGKKMVKEARLKFEEMCAQAKSQGFTIRAMSTYRSYSYQVNLYNNYVAQDGKTAADRYSARPGFSEHQTGLTADVDNRKVSYTSFEETKEFKWMQQNAHHYGFILRYPEGKEDITGYQYESWHYRYVGEKIATYIHEHDLTFDEYYVRFIEDKK